MLGPEYRQIEALRAELAAVQAELVTLKADFEAEKAGPSWSAIQELERAKEFIAVLDAQLRTLEADNMRLRKGRE